MRSSNPLQGESVYERTFSLEEHPMTAAGTAVKLIILSLVMLSGAFVTYYQFMQGHFDFVNMLMTGGIAIGFITAVLLYFKPNAALYLAPVYAVSQGAAVSGFSCSMEQAYRGIVMQAALLTLLTVLVMALLYSLKIIKASERFRSTLLAASSVLFIFYLLSFILTLFGINVPYFTQNTPLNIAVNIAIAGMAACFLILDFDFIQKGIEKGAPAVFEWYGAFSLLVTVLWLYVEILRLLSRFRSR